MYKTHDIIIRTFNRDSCKHCESWSRFRLGILHSVDGGDVVTGEFEIGTELA